MTMSYTKLHDMRRRAALARDPNDVWVSRAYVAALKALPEMAARLEAEASIEEAYRKWAARQPGSGSWSLLACEPTLFLRG